MEVNQYHTDLEIFSHNLLWLRIKYGYSEKTMAKHLKIGVASLRKLERGEIPPRLSVDFLLAVHKHFGIAPSALFSVWLE